MNLFVEVAIPTAMVLACNPLARLSDTPSHVRIETARNSRFACPLRSN